MQSFVGIYELDIYGYISLSNVKYIVFKLETKLNPICVNPQERHLRMIFEKLHQLHTQMLLNPFFDLSWAKDGAALALHESTLAGMDEDEDDISSGSGSSRSSNNSLDDENRSGSLPENVKLIEIKKQQAKHFSAKRHSKECL